MKVSIHSRKQVAEMEPDPTVCLISISTPGKYYTFHPKLEGWKYVLLLFFDDVQSLGAVTFLGTDMVRFHDEQADELLGLIHCFFTEDFVIHCDAGISRSVAVGCFMRDCLGYRLELHGGQDEGDMNRWVYRVLSRRWLRFFRAEPIVQPAKEDQ